MALVTTRELTTRLEWTLDEDEMRVAAGALEDLSDEALMYGKESWLIATPQAVKNLIVKAAARFMRNPDGYITSRAGDETVTWTDRGEDSGGAYFTEREIKSLQRLAGRGGLVSVETVAWGPTRTTDRPSYVPADIATQKPFPLYTDPVSPW